MRSASSSWVPVLLFFVARAAAAADGEPGLARVDFAREIDPLLRRSCFDCHGPLKQKGDLRLDQSRAPLEAADLIVPGHPEASELLRRVSLPHDDEEFMPARGAPLTAGEVEQLRRWIREGAEWPARLDPVRHWSYVKPNRPPRPRLQDTAWPRNAIDEFILARLEQDGLRPSPEADRATLIRRVSLDLVGLPPAPAEVAAFLADASPLAYERLVERLLASPRFGERWARPWLDLARYSDSHGFQRDDLRDLWAYRDWVIDALNADMPFDRFSVEQLAGDLLPGATEAQRIATGFHRCSPTNVEAGSIPEETRINQVLDRVNTTATIWLGTTLACAQCHDHKYDPFSQKDYYQLYAFFNNTEIEADRSNPKVTSSIRFLGPSMPLDDPATDGSRRRLDEERERVRQAMDERRAKLADDLGGWVASLAAELTRTSRSSVLRVTDFQSAEGAASTVLDDGSVLLADDPPDRDTYSITATTDLRNIRAFRLDALTDPRLPGSGPGRGDARRPNFVLNQFAVRAAPRGRESESRPIALVGARASYSQAKFAVSGAIDDDPKSAWAIGPRFGEPHWAVFRTDSPVDFPGGCTLTFTLSQEFGGARTIGRVKLSAITGDPELEQLPGDVSRLVATPHGQWTAGDRARLLDYRASRDDHLAQLQRQAERIDTEIARLATPTTLVMKELAQPRVTRIFRRGEYRTPGETVTAATPAALHPFPDGPRNRLTLARWLVDPANPLVARATVNRWWAELFGHGLVGTVEDFGLKGDRPTHPELLDLLATGFVEAGWSMKAVLRRIVLSATYRQSSTAAPEHLARDPANRLYARGPRLRLDAETIRDNALAIADLISFKAGGPPIRPYQPEGIWDKIGGLKYDYVVSPGEDRYRRGIYVVWKRGAPYPSFVSFDATERLTCTVRRSRTNTPQQALTLLNDPVYVEAALGLARRVVTERPGADLSARLAHAFRICVARAPDAEELRILETLYRAQLEAARRKLPAISTPDGPVAVPAGLAPAEFAAWHAVATVLLNLDETITKG